MTTSQRLTQAPLLAGLTADDSTCLQPDTPASHSPSLDRDLASPIAATSGRRLADSWPMSGRAGVCLKTLLVTSRWDSMRSGTIWMALATPAKRRLFRLAPSAPRIGATASGSSQQTSDWWTPTAAIAAGEFAVSPEMAERSRQSPGGNLIEQVAQRMWPTLDAAPAMPGQKLSAAWVTRLMGYPDGWLDLEGPETPGPEIGKKTARGWSLQNAIDAESCTD